MQKWKSFKKLKGRKLEGPIAILGTLALLPVLHLSTFPLFDFSKDDLRSACRLPRASASAPSRCSCGPSADRQTPDGGFRTGSEGIS